jgi:imidazolonepropionase-like amidohydrolase
VQSAKSAALGLILTLSAAPPALAQQGTWALVNARIETVTRGTIERGTILLRDGLISAVGTGLAVPPDAVVVDLTGRTVSPGLIDLISSAGVPSAPTPAPTTSGSPSTQKPGLDPDRLVAESVLLSPSDAKSLRGAGITAILAAPSRGLFRGQSALLPTRDSAGPSDVIRSPVAQHLGYQGMGSGEYPGSLLGVIAMQRQMFYDARRYGMVEDRWRANPRGVARPERDPRLEALTPAARGAQPVWIEARNENEIRRANRLANELGLTLTVYGATEAWRAIDALKGAGVVVSVDFPRPTEVTGWRFRTGMLHGVDDSAAALEAAKKLIEKNAAALNNAGIKFALSSGGRPSELLPGTRKAVAAGLPAAVALEALTIRAAQLAGVAEALGSIETGKIANLVVSTGPLLADSSTVVMVFVDGERFVMELPVTAGGRAGGPAGSATPSVSSVASISVGGAWAITSNSPQGSIESTLTIQQSGNGFTGSMASQMMGTTPVADGMIAGKKVTWSVTVTFGGQSITISYAGEVEGSRMTGTVTAGSFGSFPFTGEKKP